MFTPRVCTSVLFSFEASPGSVPFCLEPFEVGFVETVYAVSEGAVVEVCVNLTQPKLDILDEFVVVEVVDYCSSVYVPTNTLLASELFL